MVRPSKSSSNYLLTFMETGGPTPARGKGARALQNFASKLYSANHELALLPLAHAGRNRRKPAWA